MKNWVLGILARTEYMMPSPPFKISLTMEGIMLLLSYSCVGRSTLGNQNIFTGSLAIGEEYLEGKNPLFFGE